MADYITDSSDQHFVDDVIQASAEMPVIVDFWAPWCGPCKQLMPALERVVTAQNNKGAAGKVKLVKVNIDDNPAIAGQLGVRSIPAVFAFRDGQPVDGFMGGQPESELQKFVARLTGETDPKVEAATLTTRAKDSLSAGDPGGAAQDFATALQLDPEHAPALAGLARIYIDQEQLDAARAIVKGAPEAVRDDPELVALRNKLGLSDDAPAPDALAKLRAAVEASPRDLDAKYALAQALSASGHNAEAVDHLIDSVRANRAHADEAARMLLLQIFEQEGVDSDIAKSGRQRLASILYA